MAGCSGDVPIAPPAPTAGAEGPCEDLDKALPDTVSGQAQRPTDPASPLTAAWGDPAITLRCGVSRPEQLTPTSELVTVDGVDWLPVELTGGYRFVSVGREAYVQVDVPRNYTPEINALVTLAGPVSSTVPLSADPAASPAPS